MIQLTVSRLGDHIGGLLCLLASAMNGDGGTVPGVEDPRIRSAQTKRVFLKEFYHLSELT